MSKPDGGTAFPTPDVYGPNDNIQYGQNGMSLRDYFAAAALTGLLANTKLTKTASDNYKGDRCNKWFTDTAYGFADAMIAERAKQ